jgi:hypothetical protein
VIYWKTFDISVKIDQARCRSLTTCAMNTLPVELVEMVYSHLCDTSPMNESTRILDRIDLTMFKTNEQRCYSELRMVAGGDGLNSTAIDILYAWLDRAFAEQLIAYWHRKTSTKSGNRGG